MNVGDLYWVEFPQGAGRAQAGRRPAVVAQTLEATRQLPTVLMVPLTSQLDALRFPGTVLVEPDSGNGLRCPSVALVFQLVAIDRRFLAGQIGNAAGPMLREVFTALDELMGRREAAWPESIG